jgi:hypothetical protein
MKLAAQVCLLANLMEQFHADQTFDLYHQMRKIAYYCQIFTDEVGDCLVLIVQWTSIAYCYMKKDEYRSTYEVVERWTNHEIQVQSTHRS